MLKEWYLAAVISKDRRFDGVFFTCVKTTKIYCRPICPAITPKLANCKFVKNEVEAESLGYRPCLRCRPELAPKTQQKQTSNAQSIAKYIDETLLIDETLGNIIPKRFNITDRHARRLFKEEFGVEIKKYVNSKRLLFAKQLLQDTVLSIEQVAYSSGFGSPARLTMQMKQVYGLTPSKLRASKLRNKQPPVIILRADYRPPFDWDSLISFIAKRATSLERIHNKKYYRKIDNLEVSVENCPSKNCLNIQIPVQLSGKSYQILQRIRSMFDLDANPVLIEKALSKDELLGSIIKNNPGVRVPGCWDEFEMLLRVVIGQQVSVAGATTLMSRLISKIGNDAIAIANSTPQDIAKIGIPLKRATTIWTMANLKQKNILDLKVIDPELFASQLVKIPGIGRWTMEYALLRILRWPDVLPAGDLGIRKAIFPGKLLGEKEVREKSEVWQPWRSYATMLLWKSLENQGE